MKQCPNPDCRHRELTGNPAEFQDEIERCTDCGTFLVPAESDEPPTEGVEREGSAVDLVTVATFFNPYEAHLTRCHLESVGLTALVLHEYAPYRSLIDWVRVQVPRSEGAAAVEVLEEWELEIEAPSVEDRIAHLERPIYLARLAAAANGIAHLLIAIPLVLGYLYAVSPSSLASRPDETETYRYGYSPGQEGRDVWATPEPAEVAVVGAIALVSILAASIYIGCFVAARRSPVPALQVGRLLFFIEMGITIVLSMPSLAEAGWTLLSACVGVLWFSRGIDAGREVARLRTPSS